LKIIAGNCILEDIDTTIKTAEFLRKMSNKYSFELIYKSSWLKDNRSSATNYTGPDVPDSYSIFKILHSKGFTILTDIHDVWPLTHSIFDDCVDIYQLPAYLCMQTSLIRALADTKKPINIKKGQFLHPVDVGHIIGKFQYFGNNNLMITERGTCFGYRDLIVDPRSLHILKQFGYPVFLDVGHSCRKYGIPSNDIAHGGDKGFASTFAKVATALDCNIFVEVHPEPEKAACDAATQLSFDEFERMMIDIVNV